MSRLKKAGAKRSAEYWRQLATLLFSLGTGTKVVMSLGGDDLSVWQAAAVAVLVVVSLLAHRYIWQEELNRSPVVVGAPDDLSDANERWLSEPGRVVIVTRDMSWSMTDGVRRALNTKAGNGEITAFVWTETNVLRELRAAGAVVHVMPGAAPKVRFTVLRHGTSDERVLVHRQSKGRVEFYDVSPSDFPAYWLTRDIVGLLRATVAVETHPVAADDA